MRFIAGGTNLVDFMKLNVETPRQLVDINGLPFDKIERDMKGALRLAPSHAIPRLRITQT